MDTFCPGRQKSIQKTPLCAASPDSGDWIRRIFHVADFCVTCFRLVMLPIGYVNTPAKNSCACPLQAMFAEHRCSSEPVVRSGLRSAEYDVLIVVAEVYVSDCAAPSAAC